MWNVRIRIEDNSFEAFNKAINDAREVFDQTECTVIVTDSSRYGIFAIKEDGEEIFY